MGGDDAARPLRLMVFDRHDGRGLSTIWRVGGWLYRALGRLDAHRGVATWPEALAWLATVAPGRPIAEIQVWSHGAPGQALMRRGEPLGVGALEPSDPLHGAARRVRDRLVRAPTPLWWFRTCATLGGAAGQRFAVGWADFMGARVAGHTRIIGAWQSGLQVLWPGAAPAWSEADGASPDGGRRLGSGPRQPRTITFLHGAIPERWQGPPPR